MVWQQLKLNTTFPCFILPKGQLQYCTVQFCSILSQIFRNLPDCVKLTSVWHLTSRLNQWITLHICDWFRITQSSPSLNINLIPECMEIRDWTLLQNQYHSNRYIVCMFECDINIYTESFIKVHSSQPPIHTVLFSSFSVFLFFSSSSFYSLKITKL